MGALRRPLWFLYRATDLVFNRLLAGAEIPAECYVGQELVLQHGARGVVIHPTATIGNQVTLYHQVTLGYCSHIADGVTVYAGAKVLEHVKIGAHAVVGANAVVTKDVSPGDVVAGVPARPIKSRRNVKRPD